MKKTGNDVKLAMLKWHEEQTKDKIHNMWVDRKAFLKAAMATE